MPNPSADEAPPRRTVPRAGPVRGIPGLLSVALVGSCLTLTAALTDGAMEHSDLAAHDPTVTDWLVHSRTPALDVAAQVVTAVGSEPAVGLLTVLAVAWLVRVKRAYSSAVLLAGSMAVAAVVSIGLKHLVGRVRPPAGDVLGPVDSGFSFPSGHTLFSTVFFGVVAGLLLTHLRGRAARVLVVVGWLGASAAVGASRLYLGYHWLTDVLASYALAVVILVAGATAARAFHRQGSRAARRTRGVDVDAIAGAGS